MNRKFLKDSKALLFVSSLNTLLGIGLQFFLIKILGIGTSLDAFFIAISLHQFWLTIFNSIISKSLTYQLINSDYAQKLFSQTIIGITFLSLVIIGLMLLTSSFWIALFDNNENLKVLIPYVISALVFSASASCISSYLHSIKRHVIPEISSLLSFIFYTLCIILFNKNDIIFFGIMYLMKEIVFFLIQVMFVYKYFIYKKLFDKILFDFSNIRSLTFGSLVYKSGPVIDRMFLSSLAPGAVSLFTYGELAFNSINRILNRVFEQQLIVVFSENLKKVKKYQLVFLIIGILLAVFNYFAYQFVLSNILKISGNELLKIKYLNFFYSLLIPISFILIYQSSLLLSKGKFNIYVGYGILFFLVGLGVKAVLIYGNVGLVSIPLGLLINLLLLYIVYCYVNFKNEKGNY